MKISASNFIGTIEKCQPFSDEGGKKSECTEMSTLTLDHRRACCMCCFPSLSCLLNLCFELFSPRCVSSFFQVEPYFIVLVRAHVIIPTFPILVSSAEFIQTLFTSLPRSLSHRAGWSLEAGWAFPLLQAAFITHLGPQI